MFQRVKSEIWVSALLRRAQGAGAFATVLQSGAAEAGAIFIVVTKGGLNSTCDFYAPAPQSLATDEDEAPDRKFELRFNDVDQDEIDRVLASERRFDPDFWAIEIEDRYGRPFCDVVEAP